MESATRTAAALKKQIAVVEAELKKLKCQLETVENEERLGKELDQLSLKEFRSVETWSRHKWPLLQEEYTRYGRQMVVPIIGIQVLIVGAGGLGCPAAAYLAGAGVGTLGLVDGDIVELSNLHRQILHATSRVGMMKVESAINFLRELNPKTKYQAYMEHLTPDNAETIVTNYDLVLDCTDHPTSRYLISDICVLLQKPLISASALRTDGQLITLNSPSLPPGSENGGPCYRCVFPKPPPVESVVSCGEGGILGPVVGVMGVLQALEGIRLIATGKVAADGQRVGSGAGAAINGGASMLLFSALSTPPFRSVRLKGRRKDCLACSAFSKITLASLRTGSLNYAHFCGIATPINILRPEERIEPREYVIQKGKDHLLVDVREKVQFDICNIEGSINVPFSSLQGQAPLLDAAWIPTSLPNEAPIYIICRLGNDSQIVAKKLKQNGLDANGRYIGDIKGGLKSWRDQVDPDWPVY